MSQKEKNQETLSNLLENTFDLVPSYGPAKTTHGEIFRALHQLVYGYFNNGDVAYSGFGVDQVGIFLVFLIKTTSIPFSVRKFIEEEVSNNSDYSEFLLKITRALIKFTENSENNLNSDDCLNEKYSPYKKNYSYLEYDED